VDMVSSEENFRFSWSYTFQGHGAYTMYTDGSSYIDLPITGNVRPQIQVDTPEDNAEVSGKVSISGIASDDNGNDTLQLVELTIDNGSWFEATETTNWFYQWNTSNVENGAYSIKARAFDGELNSDIVEITLNVNNEQPNTIPEVSILNPEDGDKVSGSITIEGEAMDDDGDDTLEYVEISISDVQDGEWMEVSGTSGWEFDWDTTQMENSEYDIRVRAYDGIDHSKILTTTVEVKNIQENNIPVITIQTPEDGSEVSGSQIIEGEASDEDGDDSIEYVQISVNGGEWEEVTGTESWTYQWDTITVANGEHTLEFRAYDGTDYSVIETLVVVVKNEEDNVIPEITVNSPLDQSIVSGTIYINGQSADDETAIEKVELSIDDGPWILMTGTTTWSIQWDTTEVDNGAHVLSLRCFDGEEYSNLQSIMVSVQNNDDRGDGEDEWYQEPAYLGSFSIAILALVVFMVLMVMRRNDDDWNSDWDEEEFDDW